VVSFAVDSSGESHHDLRNAVLSSRASSDSSLYVNGLLYHKKKPFWKRSNAMQRNRLQCCRQGWPLDLLLLTH